MALEHGSTMQWQRLTGKREEDEHRVLSAVVREGDLRERRSVDEGVSDA